MGISLPHLLVVLTIVVLLFGTRRLKDLGGDLGEAVKGFRGAVNDQEQIARQDNMIKNGNSGQTEG